MTAGIFFTRESAIATVTLSNESKLNALTVLMWRELAAMMRTLSADDDLRCIVIRGAGTAAFAAGADIAEFATVRDNLAQGRQYHEGYVQGALDAIEQCRHPTIAMIHGPCVGGGLEIACRCDLRISGESGRFGVPINRLGFSIAAGELAALLPLTGRTTALELLVEGRIWTAAEACEKKLLTRVVPDERLQAETSAAAQRIADGAPRVARWHKEFIRRLNPSAQPLTGDEQAESYAYFDTADYRIGYEAFMQKKKPGFTGR